VIEGNWFDDPNTSDSGMKGALELEAMIFVAE
jgi:hypothetical protein